ncbi:MAG: DUF2812 domain-containing protein [Tissierellia bacterium]|nr:DUF2812 domain-containing protein [Tissierellia bacterium]
MGKMIRKWRPDDYWRIGEHESWFQDMALEGLHLRDIGYRMAKFEEGEPKKTKYRIDIYQGEHTNKEQKQFYAESGWDFVTNYDDFNIYSSPVELNAPELHSDPKEQAYTLKTLEDKMNALFFLNTIGPIAIIFIIYYILIKDSNFYLALLDNFTLRSVWILLIGSRGFFDSTRSYFAIKKLRKELLEGKQINHNAPWENRNRKNKIISRTLFVLALLFLTIPLISITKTERKTLPVSSSNLPLVRLADVEKDEELIIDEQYFEDEINYSSYYEYNWNLLAHIQYESNENGSVPNKTWDHNNQLYTPRIITDYYKLSIPKMSEKIFDGIVKKEKSYSKGEFTQVYNPNFEKLIIHKHDRFNEAIAYKGSVVIKVRYFGEQAIENIIQAMEDKIDFKFE